ncbi:MAG: RNA 2',3'-cyclic phosphodiesterase [Candidatus Contendobacter odensis]|uniref:RNA 2',3'-cyclic phosphodiesterase n=1 Tax=Candidatus Contendibacter odensensis TaxID=1400860 RepID=A0A2G6PEX0_9GAMM|nr:MAG: RNA 2',3'-cyclic phosphodiesterase [Candidatus Contendobacter odensis]
MPYVQQRSLLRYKVFWIILSEEKPRRLWPEDPERQQLARLAAQAAGKSRVRDANLHLTLVFLGHTEAAHLAAYKTALSSLSVPLLDLRLDRYGYWPGPRILWLGCSRTPPELYTLVADLNQRLQRCGFTPERRAFQAHITLARRFSGAIPNQPLAEPLRWQTNEIVLVESLPSPQGARYHVLSRWPTED